MVRLGSLFFCLLILHAFATEDFNEDPIIPSTPEQLATLYASQSYLIGGLISPLSGQLSLSQVDLDVKGSTPFNLSRTYIFPSIPSEFPRHKKNKKSGINITSLTTSEEPTEGGPISLILYLSIFHRGTSVLQIAWVQH